MPCYAFDTRHAAILPLTPYTLAMLPFFIYATDYAYVISPPISCAAYDDSPVLPFAICYDTRALLLPIFAAAFSALRYDADAAAFAMPSLIAGARQMPLRCRFAAFISLMSLRHCFSPCHLMLLLLMLLFFSAFHFRHAAIARLFSLFAAMPPFSTLYAAALRLYCAICRRLRHDCHATMFI